MIETKSIIEAKLWNAARSVESVYRDEDEIIIYMEFPDVEEDKIELYLPQQFQDFENEGVLERVGLEKSDELLKIAYKFQE